MKKSWLAVLIAVVGIAIAAVWSLPQTVQPSAAGGKPEYILRLGHGANLTNARHIAAVKYAEWVATQTNGRVKIEIFPSELLGSDKQMIALVEEGSLDMTLALPGLAANYAPQLTAVELPFLFSSMEKVSAVLDGPIGEELARDMPQKGLRLLAYWDNGLRQITNSKHPIEKPADLQGLKFRTPESKMTMSIFRALGADPAPLAWNEVYLALAQGRFDGQENPIANIHGAKLQEVQSYLSITNHKYESNPLVINEKTWQHLPADIQKVLKEGAVKFALENRKMNQESEAKLLADLAAKGMKVSRPDITAFREATKPVYDEWKAVLGAELIDKVIAAAK